MTTLSTLPTLAKLNYVLVVCPEEQHTCRQIGPVTPIGYCGLVCVTVADLVTALTLSNVALVFESLVGVAVQAGVDLEEAG